MIFIHLISCDKLKEVDAIINTIKSKSNHFGFGSEYM